MSKALSLKLDDNIFSETERVIRKVGIPRNAYINRAIDFYNRCQQRNFLKKRLRKDVVLLRDQTRDVIRDFELLEDLPE